MPWQCRLLSLEEWESRSPDWWVTGALQVGDMTFAPWMADHSGVLSPEYKRDWQAKRLPLVVVVPGPDIVCVDVRASDPNGQGLLPNGWTVTGAPPNITVRPSIDLSKRRPGGWHGWIKDGVID